MDDLLNTDACSMPNADRPVRLEEFDALFATAVRGVEILDALAERARSLSA
jgi:hypothetical protein